MMPSDCRTRRLRSLVLLLAALPAGLRGQTDDYAEDLAAAERLLLNGSLARARTVFEDILHDAEAGGGGPNAATVKRCQQGLREIAFVQGEYADVQTAIEGLPAAARDRADRLLLARALARVGAYEPAMAELERVLAADAADFEAAWLLGTLQAELGRPSAQQTWRAAIELAGENTVRDGVALTWLARCYMSLGGRANFERGSSYLVEAIRVAPERPLARIAYAELQFLAYNEAAGFPSGEKDYKAVLRENGEIEDALLGLYRLRRANFQLDPAQTQEYLQRALALNPRCVPAMMEIGAALLGDRRFEEAAAQLDRALAINPRDKRVLAHRAAAALVSNRTEDYEGFRQRALAIDPGYADLDRIIGDHLTGLYRFADAIPFYAAALTKDGESVEALHGLGKALVYTGQGDAAAEPLAKAEALHKGLVHPWRRNAIAIEKLLADEYQVVEHGSFRFRIHRDDLAVLGAYLPAWHADALEELGAKYGVAPEHQVTVEVYHTWDDFSVRTIGFRGFTALGACFGKLITLVSPGDELLRRQDFMWSATVWHEYAHVLTLALSRHRVPRWLTEGLSVYEERQKNPAWERGMDRQLLDAWHNREIPALRELNQLFRGPQILFGYYLGGVVVDCLAREHGFAKVVEYLRGYGTDRPAEELFSDAFGYGTAEFDRRFREHVARVRLAGLRIVPRSSDATIGRLQEQLARKPDDHAARVALGWAFAHRRNPLDAARELRLVLRDQPEHGEALLLHAELLRQREARDEALGAYARGFAAGADDFDSRIAYGRLLADSGKIDEAIEQYHRAKACWPACTDQGVAPNLLLARLLRKTGRETEAMMELKAYCQRTARAFEPRLELAALERAAGKHAEQARYLREAVEIDPFMRQLHVDLGDAYVALDQPQPAAVEYEIALAVRPEMDRAWLGKPKEEIPAPESEPERRARAAIRIKLARVQQSLGVLEKALEQLDRAVAEDPGGEAAREAQRLRSLWVK
jgi:tetratricopeptide (TPR) repeat protein